MSKISKSPWLPIGFDNAPCFHCVFLSIKPKHNTFITQTFLFATEKVSLRHNSVYMTGEAPRGRVVYGVFTGPTYVRFIIEYVAI